MKKTAIVMFAATAILLGSASCSQSTASLVKDYVNAANKGDVEKAEKLEKKLDERKGELTDEQVMQVAEATNKLVSKMLN